MHSALQVHKSFKCFQIQLKKKKGKAQKIDGRKQYLPIPTQIKSMLIKGRTHHLLTGWGRQVIPFSKWAHINLQQSQKPQSQVCRSGWTFGYSLAYLSSASMQALHLSHTDLDLWGAFKKIQSILQTNLEDPNKPKKTKQRIKLHKTHFKSSSKAQDQFRSRFIALFTNLKFPQAWWGTPSCCVQENRGGVKLPARLTLQTISQKCPVITSDKAGSQPLQQLL